jgi:hypothetical protein
MFILFFGYLIANNKMDRLKKKLIPSNDLESAFLFLSPNNYLVFLILIGTQILLGHSQKS